MPEPAAHARDRDPETSHMRFIEVFQLGDFFDSVVSIVAAFVLGTLIGAERQYRQRVAGLRTNVLVAVASAVFVDLAMRIAGPDGAVRVISYVVSGVGFLGAGTIMKEGANVRGLNTAATLWGSAAVGACAGADMLADAALATVAVIMGNTLLRPVVNAINATPLNARDAEGEFEVRVTVADDVAPEMRGRLTRLFSARGLPVAETDMEEVSEHTMDVVVTLVATSLDTKRLDAALEEVRHDPRVLHAGWEMNTVDK